MFLENSNGGLTYSFITLWHALIPRSIDFIYYMQFDIGISGIRPHTNTSYQFNLIFGPSQRT